MKLKHLVAAMAVALCGGAQAAYDLGVLDQNSQSFGKAFFRAFGVGSTLGNFTDHYTFKLLGNSDASGGANVAFEWGSVDLDLNSVSLSGGTLGATVTDDTPQSFSFSNLGAGTYTLDVSGVLKSVNSGFGFAYYQGAIQSVASAAPEPEALALMVAGLLGVGAMTARRKKA